ncbi:MAG TPA: DUF2262 domain-containing protein [Verrucomicrobiae bacterium]|nr:DUF2262 domain-containing protein [Verrucomicrobiae bacterium]
MNTAIHEDPEFGTLTWDTKLDEWQGQSSMTDGTKFRLSVATPAENQTSAEIENNPDKTITTESRIAFQRIRQGDTQIRAKIADENLSLYSDWHDGERITSEDFQNRLQLDSVRLGSSGDIQIYYSGDGMFYGHSLIAFLNPDGTLDRTELFG